MDRSQLSWGIIPGTEDQISGSFRPKTAHHAEKVYFVLLYFICILDVENAYS